MSRGLKVIHGAGRASTVLGVLALIVLASGAMVDRGDALQSQTFPHRLHESLFPLCTGCHDGITEGDAVTSFPDPRLCGQCHDGEAHRKVGWTGRNEPVTNVRFDHVVHVGRLSAAGDSALTCEGCHTPSGRPRMTVTGTPQMNTCWGCHAHQATSHFVDANCSTCHVPLAGSGFGTARIARLPVPADHKSDDFVLQAHGTEAQAGTARCATCHTAERCLTCHVDGSRKEIQAVPAAPATMELPPAEAHYPVPGSHTDEGWLSEHGRQAPVGQCNTCHTSNDCLTCHVGSVPELVRALPARAETRAPGVGVQGHAPGSHDSRFFMKAHATLAAADDRGCQTCHTESFCVACHDGPSNGGYHPQDFVSRHPAEAFGQDAECSACHNTAVFCRDCHVQSGLSSSGRLGAGYHTAEPLWLLRHGQAARQNLESCSSCHKQRDCLQCHSVLGAFKVSPHGENFDARSAWAANPRTCLACHLKNPLDGNEP